ncbi:MAG TPA: hypothetical protein VK900_07255 [Anaerolineales bacterium]|nr:hypothetical protein [Anaerolineales bacterium]
MQTWPYADFTHIDVEHFRSRSKKDDPLQRWDYLLVEAVLVSENTVQFFDHYLQEYKSQRNELDEYLQKLGTDGWKLIFSSKFDGKQYQFRRYQFRRELK